MNWGWGVHVVGVGHKFCFSSLVGRPFLDRMCGWVQVIYGGGYWDFEGGHLFCTWNLGGWGGLIYQGGHLFCS